MVVAVRVLTSLTAESTEGLVRGRARRNAPAVLKIDAALKSEPMMYFASCEHRFAIGTGFQSEVFDKKRWDWEQEQNRLTLHRTPCISPKRVNLGFYSFIVSGGFYT